MLGELLGLIVGFLDGTHDGLLVEGAKDSAVVGNIDGMTLGETLGLLEGLIVGKSVGLLEG